MTSREQADTWDTFVKLGGGKDIFDKNKEKILSEPKAKSLKEILEFTEGSKPTSETGATKFTAKPVDVKQKSFGPSIITVQTLGWSSQSNWVADNYWQNNLCDGDGADLDWEYAYYFGEPTYAYQFRVWGSSGPVAALLYWYQYNVGGVIGRAPGNGDVILCIGNGGGNLPDWYVAYSMNMWR